MAESESKFGMPPERLQELRQRHQRDEEEAQKQERPTTMAEISARVEKELEETKAPLEPTKESLLYIEEEGKFLTERQQELLKVSAYFTEKEIEQMFDLLSEKGRIFYGPEELKGIEGDLMALKLKYEDILDRQREYPAARKMIKDVEKYLEGIKEASFEQPAYLVWRNIANRIESFHQIILPKEAKTIDQKFRLSQLTNNLKVLIFSRIPIIVPGPPKNKIEQGLQKISEKIGQLKQEEHLTLEDKNRLTKETEDAFRDLGNYMEEHHSYDHVPITFSKETGLKLRSEFIDLIQQKGTAEGTITDHGKRIVLKGEDIAKHFGGQEIEIWHPGGEHPVHISVKGLPEGSKPHYIAVEATGEIRSAVNVYDDVPATVKAAEETKAIKPSQWEEFLNSVLALAREYKPERQKD